MLSWVLRMIVFLAGAALCRRYLGPDLWIVGLIFGAVAVFWHATLNTVRPWRRYVVYVAGSVLIYSFVLFLVRLRYPPGSFWEYVYVPVVAGTLLMVLLYRGLFGPLAVPVWAAAVIIYGVWYFGGFLDSGAGFSMINSMSFWQAAYLLCVFWKPVKGPRFL
ncbi:MAG: hypothetical protein A2Z83_06840 [Omnitrophica bacterium GWA2_52_8]|nr:MAG: hypothetical protein A2Z83_06840 [Omnitrophica bacterium GWA2_52_8]